MAHLHLVPEHDTLIGGKYRLGPVIGSGGVATVYRATHVWTEREVAVKLLDPKHPQFEWVREGFLREARATVQLKHPNVVDVLDMGEDDWQTVYMVMELLRGPTLRDVLSERGRLPEGETLALLLPLIDALEKAHQQGVVHRDFKPENIILARDAYGAVTPKLLDFGIAEILHDARSQSLVSRAGLAMGTPDYMSPEQASDQREKMGPHTDVWGLGVVWYECLTGRVPFDGESVEEVLEAVCHAPIDFEPLPGQYAALLSDVLLRPTELRVASCEELKARISATGVARFSVPASASSVPPPTESMTRELAPARGSELRSGSSAPKRNATVAAVLVAIVAAVLAWWTVRGPHEGRVPGIDPVVAESETMPERVVARSKAPPEPQAIAKPDTALEGTEPDSLFANALPTAPPVEAVESEARTEAEPAQPSEAEPAESSEAGPAESSEAEPAEPSEALVQDPEPAPSKPSARRARRRPVPESRETPDPPPERPRYAKPPELVDEW